jgi:hypothetical protein
MFISEGAKSEPQRDGAKHEKNAHYWLLDAGCWLSGKIRSGLPPPTTNNQQPTCLASCRSAAQRGDNMHAHEVMREVLKKTSAKQIAAEMALSLSLIYKWAESPEDQGASGANSPLERVGQLIRITRDARIAQWVCEQANGFFINNPQNLPAGQPLIPVTNDIVQEFADMLATIATSSADSVITKDEARNIRRRWEELKSVTEGFVTAAETGGFSGVTPEPAVTPVTKPKPPNGK